MTFEFAPKRYDLTFADGDLAGLEVSVGSLSIDGLLCLEMALYSAPDDDTPKQVAKYREVLEVFTAALRSWNLAAAGVPVGTDLASVTAQDSSLILRIVRQWYRALVTPPDPLANGSAPTPGTELEASMPMATSSPSQPN